MKLLIDTDAFCKLAVSHLLSDAIQLLGARIDECAVLPALPHMLRRGALRRRFGSEVCDSMIHIAESLSQIKEADAFWLEMLRPIPAIDPGEALVFAAAAEAKGMVLSGDKRALRALKKIKKYRDALEGRVIVTEAILLALCHEVGLAVVRRNVQPLMRVDTAIRMCFLGQQSRPMEGLTSYFDNLQSEVSPLVLRHPSLEG